MQYYIDTIEQVKGENDSINEYGQREKVSTESLALSKYYTKLANVAADMDKNHYYMDIKIMNSDGGCIKKDKLGTYHEAEE